MLADELKKVSDIIFNFEQNDFELRQSTLGLDHFIKTTLAVKISWRKALFSDADDHSLRRYFQYHLEGISKISDTLTNGANPLFTSAEVEGYQETLLVLTDHLLEYYGHFLNHDAITSTAYLSSWYDSIAAKTVQLVINLQDAGLSAQLKNCLIAYLQKPEKKGIYKYSFSSLRYFEHMVHQLSGLLNKENNIEDSLNDLLLEGNFNHLSYYAYRQNNYHLKVARLCFSDRLEFFEQELRKMIEQPEQNLLAYDQRWPSIKIMVCNFLKEEIQFIKEREPQVISPMMISLEKIPLNLSVAHLACLLRLLYEEGCFGELNLQDLFKFFSQHFRTKRQDQISSNSLSKEYYSVSQITAAVMRDKLLKMVAYINKTFFPA